MKNYLQTILKKNNFVPGDIRKIQGEASNRSFYRVFMEGYSLVAMVYPEEAGKEIGRIVKLAGTYTEHGLRVPGIREIFDNRVMLMDDAGDLLVQKALLQFKKEKNKRRRILEEVADILIKLKGIPADRTDAVLDKARMKWEMDFFMTHFARNFLPCAGAQKGAAKLGKRLYDMVNAVPPNDTFAHRDFHSRNMLLNADDCTVTLVDFQDSLVAPAYYDLVSVAFDSYMDLGRDWQFLADCLENRGFAIDEEQLYITALQRNIKALGSFGFQVRVMENMAYKKYFNRTLRHIHANKLFGRFFEPSDFRVRV
ncbi:MAG: phosphotransferase [bacterium]|nr:phosphotransferase [bacterium]